jgi:drug/metabolite transporter (DMT)-like permease
MTDKNDESHNLTLTAVMLASLIATLWGFNSVAVRYSVDEMPPVFVAGLRFLIGAIVMVGWCRWEGSDLRLKRVEIWPCLVIGVLLFVQISLFNAGVELSTASHGSLYINTFVFWVIGIEHFITRADRLTIRKSIGVTLAGASVVLLITATDRSHSTQVVRDIPTLTGDLILCLSAFFLGVKILATKSALRIVKPGTLIFWQSVIGTVLFFLWSFAFEEIQWTETTWPSWVGVLYQGIFVAGFCFVIQARLMQTYSASQISVFAFITPLSGVAAGVWMRNDRMSPWMLLAALGIALGIYFVNHSPHNDDKNQGAADDPLEEESSVTGIEIT